MHLSWYVRRTPPRNEEMSGHQVMFSAKVACEFETDRRTHTVAEESERFIEKWEQPLRKSLNEDMHVGVCGFCKAPAPAGKLNGANLHFRRKARLPRSKNRCSASCIGETKEPDGGSRI